MSDPARRRRSAEIARRLTGAMLRLYPASFRQDVGDDLLDDVGRRASEMADRSGLPATTAWLLRLAGSLVWNGAAAWLELAGTGLFSSLDFRLGLRMLVRFPGLTLVAGLAMALAIGLGTATYQFITDWYSPTMPFADGDRIVEIWNDDQESGAHDPRALHDHEVWRDGLSTVVDVGALRSYRRNLVTEDGGSAPIVGAEMSTVAFDLAGTPPILGRPLLPSDRVAGAPEVVVLSHEIWQNRFDGDRDVIGRTVRLGSTPATVVGVMPEKFGWPRDYDVWSALRLDPLDYPRGEGPSIQVVGKVAPGASLADARAELETIGARLTLDHPESNRHLRPRIERYGSLDLGVGDLVLAAFRSMTSLAFLGLVLLVCGNVALLLYARTAARRSELVLRGALGASRARIVAQLFVEALVLGLASGAVGLIVASVGYDWVMGFLRGYGPGLVGYWIDARLDAWTILYALLFTLVASAVAGIVPALKATGSKLHGQLQRAGTSGPSLDFSRFWSAVIIAQIAATVALVPIIGIVGYGAWEMSTPSFGIPARDYLIAELRQAGATGVISDFGPSIQQDGYSTEFAASYAEVTRRLKREPGVSSVTVAGQVPGAPSHPARVVLDESDVPLSGEEGHYTRTVPVDLDFFEALGSTVQAGRAFTAVDQVAGARVAIVDEVFAQRILGNRNPVGRTFRMNDIYRTGEAGLHGSRFEIVGVVSRVPAPVGPLEEAPPFLYVPIGATETYPVRLVLRVGTDAGRFASRLREVVAEVDPDLILTDVRSLEDADWATRRSFQTWFWVLLAIGGVAVTLAMAGLYAIVSFTVSKRTREIGVRVALGADRSRVVWPIVKRAAKQIAIGSVLGTLIFWGMVTASELRFLPEPGQVAGYLVYLVAIAAVCGAACAVPVRRALEIEPTEALRSEG